MAYKRKQAIKFLIDILSFFIILFLMHYTNDGEMVFAWSWRGLRKTLKDIEKGAQKGWDYVSGSPAESRKTFTKSYTYKRDYYINGKHYGNVVCNVSWTERALRFTGYFGGGNYRENIPSPLHEYADRYFPHIIKIDTQYKLGLTQEELQSSFKAASEFYLKKENEERAQARSNSFFYRVVSGIISIGAFVITSGVSAAVWAGIFIANAVGAYGDYKQRQYNSQRANLNKKYESLERKSRDLSYKKQQRDIKNSNSILTQSIIYGNYAIYANGDIFKQGAAGSKSFGLNAYDTSKGIYAEPQDTTLDDIIFSRNGKNTAGGQQWHSNMLDFLEFPLANFCLDADFFSKIAKNNFISIQMRINEGFHKLLYKDGGEETYFAQDGRLQEKYDRVVKTQTLNIKKMLISNDFLDKNKSYQNGEMPNFNYITLKSFDKKASNNERGAYSVIGVSFKDSFKEMMESDELDDNAKIAAYALYISEAFSKLYALSLEKHIKIEKIEQKDEKGEIKNNKIQVVLENDNVVKADDLANMNILKSMFKEKFVTNLDIFVKIYKYEFLPSFKNKVIYKNNQIFASYFYETSSTSCIYLNKDEFDEISNELYLPDRLSKFDFAKVPYTFLQLKE